MRLRGTLLSLPQKCSKGRWHRGPQPTWVVTRRDGREVRIDVLVVAPMEWGEHRTLQIEVTQGPQSAIGKARVKPFHLGLAQPYAPQRVLGAVRRHLHVILGINGLSIGVADLFD